MRKKWNIQKKYDSSTNIIDCLLENRGIVNIAQKAEFLNPKPISTYLAQMPGDFKTSIKSAKELILSAVENKRPILIYGDYDTDGVCATSILYKTLKDTLGHKHALFFIPNRFEHGYGLSEKALTQAHALLTSTFPNAINPLLITVDTGITAVEEVAFAKSLGFEVVITDHHQKPQILPNANVLVWGDAVVGSTISWILSKALGLPNMDLIELAALATVTDLQELTGINRIILKKGLEVFNSNPCLGAKKLLEVAGKTKEITVYDLGWVLGPRINALGRMENASLGVELLTTNDSAQAMEIAHMLGQTNVKRQDETEKMYGLANIEGSSSNIIISAGADYHEGIIGLVASRLVQTHYKPSIVIALDDESGLGKGSVRSVPGINIIEVLRKYDNLFEKLGGHPMAAGFSIRAENIEKLKSVLIDYMNNNYSQKYFVPFLDIDLEIPLNLVNVALFTQIQDLAPYGVSNPEPVFCAFNLKIIDYSFVGKEANHLSLKFFESGNYYKAIFFNAQKYGVEVDRLSTQQTASVAFTLSKNEFNGKTSIDLILRDLLLQ